MSSDMIDYLMGQPDGANYVVLYQMLCLKTINTGGRLAFQIGDMIIPYDVEKIQRECKWFSLATVRVALEVYKQIGLIYEDKDGVLVLANYSDIVGSETDYSAQKRLQRENRRRQLPPKCADSNEDNNVDNVHTEKEIEIDKEKDIQVAVKVPITLDVSLFGIGSLDGLNVLAERTEDFQSGWCFVEVGHIKEFDIGDSAAFNGKLLDGTGVFVKFHCHILQMPV